ncbi:MAG: hypothetical protein GDA51_05465 [Ekhidna sp.]|nr:hypothetical protein [Ekhidna sp.]MBC6425910.1 hypothetical protein [Ekhidna sp.]
MEPFTFYHIYHHANDPENLFRSDENYRFFLEKWAKYIEPVADTYAYCLMPNHLHALIKVKDEKDILNLRGFQNLEGFYRYEKILSKHFSNLFNSYTKAYNKMFHRKGSLFTPNFKAKEITSDAYFTNIIFYIHHNPLHHGLCSHIADWPHSSYHALISDKLTRIKRQEVQGWFGTKEALRKFHDQAIKGLEQLENKFT